MSGRSGVGPDQRFENLAVLLVLGVRRMADAIRAAVGEGAQEPDETADTCEHVMLGVLALDQELNGLFGEPVPDPQRGSEERPREDLLR